MEHCQLRNHKCTRPQADLRPTLSASVRSIFPFDRCTSQKPEGRTNHCSGVRRPARIRSIRLLFGSGVRWRHGVDSMMFAPTRGIHLRVRRAYDFNRYHGGVESAGSLSSSTEDLYLALFLHSSWPSHVIAYARKLRGQEDRVGGRLELEAQSNLPACHLAIVSYIGIVASSGYSHRSAITLRRETSSTARQQVANKWRWGVHSTFNVVREFCVYDGDQGQPSGTFVVV